MRIGAEDGAEGANVTEMWLMAGQGSPFRKNRVWFRIAGLSATTIDTIMHHKEASLTQPDPKMPKHAGNMPGSQHVSRSKPRCRDNSMLCVRAMAIVLFSVFLLLPVTRSHANDLTNDLAPPPVRPHLLLDADSGEILSSEAPFLRWAPASLTKMMTAYVVFRQLELGHLAMNSPVRVSEAALSQPPSKMGLPIGTILTIENALNIIMVKSANDIAVALAESVAGSEEAFVALMNSHARRLGMADSHFTNPHGLHDREQYTSARDMAVLTMTISREFRKHDRFFNIPGIRVGKRRLRNHNALVERFPGTNGMKTGYVCASGFNVVVRTRRKGRELIAVVFGGDSGLERNVKAAQLLQEGFDGSTAKTGLLLSSYARPFNTPIIPQDITNRICPGKYAALVVPDPRPDDAPKASEFDPIDTQLPVEDDDESTSDSKAAKEKDAVATVTPVKRPAIVVSPNNPVIANLGADRLDKVPAAESTAVAIPEDSPPTARELEAVYLSPRKRPRDDVEVTLGGATGPNPNGIKHTDGGVYVAPTPVPVKKPSLDLADAGE